MSATSRTDAPGRVLFGLVLAVVAAGLAYLGLAPEHWLRGVFVIAVGLAVGGVARAVLPSASAGPLAVRGRVFDVACYLLAAGAVAGFGLVVA